MTQTVPGGEGYRSDLLALVDATSGNWDDFGLSLGTRMSVISERREITGGYPQREEDAGFFDPLCLRWHVLDGETPIGTPDRRMSITTVNDYEGVLEPVVTGQAPYGQVEIFNADNRSTRERDLAGRVALPGSHRKIVDDEAGLYSLAQTFIEIDMGSSSDASVEGEDAPEIPGVVFRGAGTTSGTGGSVTTTKPFVAVNGLTFFGQAAVDAGREAAAQPGAEAIDVARAASAAARGLPPPPPRTRTRDPEATRTKAKDEPEECDGPEISAKPGGYLWNGDRIGLLGTIYTLESEFLDYSSGREGTPIGAVAIRHDAHFAMAEHVGRIKFVDNDVANIKERGKLFKGSMYRDSSLANKDTAVCGETDQWRPGVRVTAAVPPEKPPPPPEPPPWVDPPPEDPGPGIDAREADPEEVTTPPRRPGSISGPGLTVPTPTGVGIGDPAEPKKLTSTPFSGGDGEPPIPPPPEGGGGGQRNPTGGPGGPVAGAPMSQERDLEGAGVPCVNTTAGAILKSDPDLFGTGDITEFVSSVTNDPDGATRSFYGYPAVNDTIGGYTLGGFEGTGAGAAAGASSGLTGPGVVVGGGGGAAAIVDIQTADEAAAAQTDDRRSRRDARTQARRDRRDERRSDRIIDLDSAAASAAKAGNTRRADRFKRAADRERGRQERVDEQREEDDAAKQRARDRHDDRVERAKDAKARKRERQRRAHEASQDKTPGGADTQGGYIIDTTDAGDTGGFGVGDIPTGTTSVDEAGGSIPSAGGFVPSSGSTFENTAGGFDNWNVVNHPISYMGSPGGAATVEGQIHRMTATVQGLQSVINGLAGGPSYFAGSLAAVDTSRPGKEVAGHILGTKHVSLPGYEVQQIDTPAVEVRSIIDANDGQQVFASGAGLMSVTREHRGGSITDKRPLIAMTNDLGVKGSARGDMIESSDRRYLVDGFAGSTTASSTVRWQEGDAPKSGHVFSVGSQSSKLSELSEWVYVDSGQGTDTQGMLVGNQGMAVAEGPIQARNGQAVDFYDPLASGELQADALPKIRIRSLGSGVGIRIFVLDANGDEVTSPRLTFGEGGFDVVGNMSIDGDLTITGEIN